MCGISGFQGTFPDASIIQLTNALAHRGPDGDGTAVFREHTGIATALGHRRLAIIDLSPNGLQPMGVRCRCCASVDGPSSGNGLSLVYNGEIYNFRELRRELENAGHTFFSATDSEVLLH